MSRITTPRAAIIALALLASGCALFDHPDACTLLGSIEDYTSAEPLPDALVKIDDRTIAPDAAGRFTVDNLAASASVQFWAPGHRIATRHFNLLPGETRTIDVPLAKIGAQVPEQLVLFERSGRIWGVDSLGSDERCLTSELPGVQASPTWLAGHSQFAFIEREPGHSSIWTRYPDGRPARFIAEVPDSADELAWHPLGNRMAFTASLFSPIHGMATSIHTVDVTTGREQDLLSGAIEANPAWSPDGTQLAWSRRQAPTPWQIWLAGGFGERPHALLRRGNCTEPAWAPTGAELAYASNTSGNWELYLAGMTSGPGEPLTHSPAGAWCRHPAWSPKGDELLFESNYHPGLGKLQATPGLYVLKLATHAVRALVTDAHHGAW